MGDLRVCGKPRPCSFNDDVYSVTSRTKPSSHFLRATLKAGRAWGRGYYLPVKLFLKYHILPKISPLPSLTSKFLHRYFYLIYKPRPYATKNALSAKKEQVKIDKDAGFRSLNGLSSQLACCNSDK